MGRSSAMAALYDQMRPLVDSDLPVLVVGETGVGKEHVARALHDSSPRRSGPFVAVNCAAIPAELIEAEMFGVARRAATGVAERAGRLSLADGGTLFLDEIGEMPLALQPKLLRALQERQIASTCAWSPRRTPS
jgi:transcriptional regulator with GAF, ATPase, and Fis domain